jgi:hypothetical protein
MKLRRAERPDVFLRKHAGYVTRAGMTRLDGQEKGHVQTARATGMGLGARRGTTRLVERLGDGVTRVGGQPQLYRRPNPGVAGYQHAVLGRENV